MAKIQFTTPAGESGEVELTAGFVSVGRADDNMLVIADESVSSHHGQIVQENGVWVFTDLGSTNGTKVDGQRVERVELDSGGAFVLGSVECVFIGDSASPSPAPSRAPARAPSGGYADMPVNKSARRGFGPKAKPQGSGSGPLMILGVIALLVCAYAAFTFTGMGG
ncbi:MAG TPA: hypothetical protein DIT13_06810 [Verrucomicrobiales bacterium]|nr:hypothetical protein [Verrucomicrobiales bacterium]HRJ07766.1 FHA domain-containing protein [Prosthecobacter sp.]HRK13925.1 FHA domain-containing protein [Prosthecobacter sp.]